MTKMLHSAVIGAGLLLAAITTLGAQTWRSSLYPAHWTPGYTTSSGHYLHDWSYAGYHRGEREIPTPTANTINATQAPYNADPSGVTDSTAAIQAALDAAGAAGGGVVYLPAGTYKIAPAGANTYALRITGNNVVLRGAGADNTRLFNSNPVMRQKNVLVVQNSGSSWWYSDGTVSTRSLITQDLLTPTQVIPVANASIFAVGNLVALRTDLTQAFIDEHGMTGKWTAGATNPRAIVFVRRITVVDPLANTITLDVPTRYFLKMRDNARVIKLSTQISEVGVEDLSIGMAQSTKTGLAENDYSVTGTAAYDVHAAQAVVFDSAENCWMRRVKSYAPPGNAGGFHLVSNGVRLIRSRHITVADCDLRKAQYKGGGGNGYLYTLGGNDCLIRDSRAEEGRHNYDFQTMACSGNVLSHCTTRNGQYASDFHMFLSTSNLIDNMTVDGDFLEAKYRPYGGSPEHGVTASENVFWNTNGLAYTTGKNYVVYDRQFNKGYTIGTRGPAPGVSSTRWVEGVGTGADLAPQSLFLDQVARRIQLLRNITVASGQTYPMLNNLAVGDKVFLESWDVATYSTIPAEFLGLTYLRTSRNDVTRTESTFITAHADLPVTMYVAYRNGYTIPSWLSAGNGWLDTGKNLVTSTGMNLRVRKKAFPAGTVTLGANQNGGGSSTLMYTVLVSRP